MRRVAGTGYEQLLYNCMIGNATLFSRTDLVETAWRVAQPMLDTWASLPMGDDSVYPAGSWGPPAAFDLMERSGRRWMEIVNRDILARIPLFQSADPVCLHKLAMMLQPVFYETGEDIIRIGETGKQMYFICRGSVEVFDAAGKSLTSLGEGEYFGELSLLTSAPRTANIRAAASLQPRSSSTRLNSTASFEITRTSPRALREQVKKRYNLAGRVVLSRLTDRELPRSAQVGQDSGRLIPRVGRDGSLLLCPPVDQKVPFISPHLTRSIAIGYTFSNVRHARRPPGSITVKAQAPHPVPRIFFPCAEPLPCFTPRLGEAPALALEPLEPRQLLASLMVTNVTDSGAGSLQQAILDANAATGPSTIDFVIPGPGVQTIAEPGGLAEYRRAGRHRRADPARLRGLAARQARRDEFHSPNEW